ncbi:MAG: hypothetical protein VX463_12010 [Pseudomonadota bacterium]|nr:hypothetical protein [Pseudomonadota bacterium]
MAEPKPALETAKTALGVISGAAALLLVMGVPATTLQAARFGAPAFLVGERRVLEAGLAPALLAVGLWLLLRWALAAGAERERPVFAALPALILFLPVAFALGLALLLVLCWGMGWLALEASAAFGGPVAPDWARAPAGLAIWAAIAAARYGAPALWRLGRSGPGGAGGEAAMPPTPTPAAPAPSSPAARPSAMEALARADVFDDGVRRSPGRFFLRFAAMSFLVTPALFALLGWGATLAAADMTGWPGPGAGALGAEAGAVAGLGYGLVACLILAAGAAQLDDAFPRTVGRFAAGGAAGAFALYLAVLHAVYVYPALPQALGGGAPEAVTVAFDAEKIAPAARSALGVGAETAGAGHELLLLDRASDFVVFCQRPGAAAGCAATPKDAVAALVWRRP